MPDSEPEMVTPAHTPADREDDNQAPHQERAVGCLLAPPAYVWKTIKPIFEAFRIGLIGTKAGRRFYRKDLPIAEALMDGSKRLLKAGESARTELERVQEILRNGDFLFGNGDMGILYVARFERAIKKLEELQSIQWGKRAKY